MSDSDAGAVPYGDLASAQLFLDAVYEGGNHGSVRDDPLALLLPVGNQGGFRYKGSVQGRSVRLVVLYTTGLDPDWPDVLDVHTGRFTYYGDNKSPGRVPDGAAQEKDPLHSTPRHGNLLLRHVFEDAHTGAAERSAIPPFFLFEKTGRGRDVRFRGLLAPGAESLQQDEELVAIWRSTGGKRFQNYRAEFTVLDVPVVTRAWIGELLAGVTTGPAAPRAWRDWVAARSYDALEAPSTTTVRSRAQQTPDEAGQRLLAEVHGYFSGRYHDFEHCAVELWKMLAPATGRCEVTQRSRDGGRDAVGEYLLGPLPDQVSVEFALEAKCYGADNPVGVREMSRLISRLKNRQFGVFVTTSYYHSQVYREVREDRHPVVMMCGKDIADLLRARGYGTPAAVNHWLKTSFG